MIKAKFLHQWNWLQQENHWSFYLAFLRVAISIWLLTALCFNWSSNEFLYGNHAFVTLKDYGINQLFFIDIDFLKSHYLLVLFIYAILIFLNILGIGKWITAFLLFLCYHLLQKQNIYMFSGGEKMASLILFYLVFANSYQYFSFFKKKVASHAAIKLNNVLSNLAAYSIMLQLCLAYFISGLSKLDAELWRSGIATYYTFSTERYMGTPWNKQLVQHAWFAYATNYFTLAFELCFPFLIWIKKLRIPLLIMGVILHAGIYIFLMVYGFQFVFLLTYGLFFSNQQTIGLYQKAIGFLKPKKSLPFPMD